MNHLSYEIKGKLDYHIMNLRSILVKLDQVKKKSDPNEILGKTILGKGVNAIASDLFESNFAGKLGEKWILGKIKMQDKQQLDNIIREQETSFRIVLNQIRDYLGNISIKKDRMKPEGNSHLLLKKLASIESTSKLRPQVQKCIGIISKIREEPLIYNSEIVLLKEKEKKENKAAYYDDLKRLEDGLRNLISSRLTTITHNWWKERIPEDVRLNAEDRKGKNAHPWPWQIQDNPLISFVDFSDYSKIIARKDNWKDAFEKVFRDKELISSKLKELQPIRHAIAHSRNLTTNQIKKLQLYTDDILKTIQNSG